MIKNEKRNAAYSAFTADLPIRHHLSTCLHLPFQLALASGSCLYFLGIDGLKPKL